MVIRASGASSRKTSYAGSGSLPCHSKLMSMLVVP